jgi:hypothetical protein
MPYHVSLHDPPFKRHSRTPVVVSVERETRGDAAGTKAPPLGTGPDEARSRRPASAI